LDKLLFFNLGGGEIFIIMAIVLLLFGAKRIPEIARGMGRGIRQFKDAAQRNSRRFGEKRQRRKKTN